MSEVNPFDFNGYLEAERLKVEGALERAVRKIERRDDVTADEASVIRYGVMGGGKRLRPILCVTAYVASGGCRSASLYDLAASVELVHAYSLMHDDLPCMDDAELRRGRPAAHIEHGAVTALWGAAKLIPLAAIQALEAARLLGCEEALARSVSKTLMRAAGGGGMVGGQWMDLMGEGRALGPEELNRLHQMKTGALLVASLEVGSVAAEASDKVRAALLEYGSAVGLAFQIVDDILDETSSSEALGKNPSDAQLQKSTYTSLHGLDGAKIKARTEIERALGALETARIECDELISLAHFVVERGR